MVEDQSPPNQRHTIDRMRYEYDDETKQHASHYSILASKLATFECNLQKKFVSRS